MLDLIHATWFGTVEEIHFGSIIALVGGVFLAVLLLRWDVGRSFAKFRYP
jgi:hypothetical protein